MKKVPARKRPKLGDVVEVRVPERGFAYVQYVKHHTDAPGYGALLRVLPGVFKRRPADVGALAAGRELYLVFFPLGAACHRSLVSVVTRVAVPDRFEDWPLFRACNENPATGKRTWFLWDGRASWKIGALPRKYHKLSIVETINLTELESRLASGWLPTDEV